MKFRHILKRLYQDGWYIIRQRGSHRQLHHPNKPGTVTVAGKPNEDADPKTQKSIFRQAQIED
jgi:predicted RNA binding protein YcfA (HicA-like mRNA interferase family)